MDQNGIFGREPAVVIGAITAVVNTGVVMLFAFVEGLSADQESSILGFVLALTALLGTAFGWLLRSAIGGFAALFVLLFVTPVLGLLLPGISRYLPSNAGEAILQTGSAGGSLPPWIGLGVYAAYVAAALTAATVALARRDA